MTGWRHSSRARRRRPTRPVAGRADNAPGSGRNGSGRGKGNAMLSETQVKEFAADWVRAWNEHDLDAILSHYAPEIELTSPVAVRLLNDSSGTVRGPIALRQYFRRGLESYPNLAFELLEVMWGLSSVILRYKNKKCSTTAEDMEIDMRIN